VRHCVAVRTKADDELRRFVLILFAISLITCGQRPQSEAELTLRHYFDLPKTASLQSKPSPLLTTFPIGTPEDEIYDFLEKSEVGKDGLSSYYRAGERGEIICRVEYDVKSPGLLKESFGVFLLLDDDRKLNSARVERWLTGP
jgi:hypothetical protein